MSFSQEKLLTAHCHEPAHISHQWTCESVSGSHLRERSDEGGTRSVAMIHRMTETEPQGSVNTTCPSTRTNVRFLSSLGRLVLSSMLDAKEQGAQRPEESTIIPFSESRYRSSDVEGRTYRRAKPIFYKCVLRGYSSLYFASQSRSASTAFVRTKCGTHVLDGDTSHTPLYARRTVRITGTSGGFPSPRKAAPTQRIMMPSSP